MVNLNKSGEFFVVFLYFFKCFFLFSNQIWMLSEHLSRMIWFFVRDSSSAKLASFVLWTGWTKVPQSSLGILKVPQLHPPLEHPPLRTLQPKDWRVILTI